MSGLGLLLLAAAVAVVSFLNQPAAEAPAIAMPESVLLQVPGDDRDSVVNFLILDGGRTWLPLPVGMVLVPGTDPITLGEAADDLNPGRAAELLSVRLDLEITEAWQLDRLALAALVDSLSGIDITSDDEVFLESGMTVPAGEVFNLSGLAASEFAVSGEGRVRAARFLEVWRAVLAETDAAFLPDLLTGLGSSSRATMSQPELVQYFEKLQYLFASDQVQLLRWIAPGPDPLSSKAP